MSVTRALRRTALGALLASGGVAACLGVEDDYGGFGGGFAGAGSFLPDAAAEQFRPACADAKLDAPCNRDNPPLACEAVPSYPNVSCDGLLECLSNGRWTEIDSENAECASISTGCPAAYTETNPNGCAIANAGTLICEYDEGTCGCAPIAADDAGLIDDAGDAEAGPLDDAGDAGDAEAGSPDAGTRYEWRCVHADHDAGCPRKRPRVGAECVRPLSCDYGVCVFEDGARMDCYSGFWKTSVTTRSTVCR